MLARALPGAILVIFLICLTSFAVALTLGGGPRATTVELAIWQAVRFDFDLGRAALLSCVQFALCAAAAAVAWRVTPVDGFGGGSGPCGRPLGPERFADWAVVGGGDSVPCPAAGDGHLARRAGAGRSGAGHLGRRRAIGGGGGRIDGVEPASGPRAGAARWRSCTSVVGVLPLAASALVMGTGLFYPLSRCANPATLALPVTLVVNAVMALPFALRVAGARGRRTFARITAGWPRRWACEVRTCCASCILPRLRRPLGFAAGLTAALSIGDLGVIALFADRRAGNAAACDVSPDGRLPHGRGGRGGLAAAGAGAWRLLGLRPGRAHGC